MWSTYLWSSLLFICGDARVESNRWLYEASIGNILLFIGSDARAKSNRSGEVHRSVAHFFLYAVLHV
jgi:hypothetical protein